jgi:hypothetical protein
MGLRASSYCGHLFLRLLGGSPRTAARLSVCALVPVSLPLLIKQKVEPDKRCFLQLDLPNTHQQHALAQFIGQTSETIFLYIQPPQSKAFSIGMACLKKCELVAIASILCCPLHVAALTIRMSMHSPKERMLGCISLKSTQTL